MEEIWKLDKNTGTLVAQVHIFLSPGAAANPAFVAERIRAEAAEAAEKLIAAFPKP